MGTQEREIFVAFSLVAVFTTGYVSVLCIALLGLANAQIQLALIPEAKKSLKDLIKKYPKSDVIQNAQKRLKVLESIKP